MNAPDHRPGPLAGSACHLAPLCVKDAAELRRFFISHSPETILARYGYTVGLMTPEHARELVGVNQETDVALGVFYARARHKTLQAVGRYYTEPGTDGAEVALIVHEESRRRGLATLLLQRLAEIARARGLKTFFAQVGSHNFAMRALFDRYGPQTTAMPGAGCIHYRLSLSAIPAPKAWAVASK